MSRKPLLALASLVAAAVATLLILDSDDSYMVRAEFKNVGGLRQNSSVKIAGVPGGKVVDIEITERDTAIAHFRMKDNAAPIGRGATVHVRPTDLLGERYAELDPGDRSRPLPSNSLISVAKTDVPVELDDVLNMLDPDTRTRLGILINEIGVGLHGRGHDLNRLLAEMPTSLGKAREMLKAVADQNETLKAVLTKGDRITATVNAKRGDMGALIDEADAALGTIAEKRSELGRTIRSAPGALRELRSTLSKLQTASIALRPFADDVRAAATPLNQTLKALPAFTRAATPTLRTAVDVAPALTRLGVKGTPTLRRLRPAADVLAQTLEPAKAIVDQLDLRGMEDILYFLQNWALGMKGRDALGHQVGAKLNIDSSYITAAVASLNAPAPTKQGKRRASRPKLPKLLGPGGGTPDVGKRPADVGRLPKKVLDELPRTLDALPEVVTGLLGGLAGSQQPAPRTGDAGGASDAMELFDYLMGP